MHQVHYFQQICQSFVPKIKVLVVKLDYQQIQGNTMLKYTMYTWNLLKDHGDFKINFDMYKNKIMAKQEGSRTFWRCQEDKVVILMTILEYSRTRYFSVVEISKKWISMRKNLELDIQVGRVWNVPHGNIPLVMYHYKQGCPPPMYETNQRKGTMTTRGLKQESVVVSWQNSHIKSESCIKVC